MKMFRKFLDRWDEFWSEPVVFPSRRYYLDVIALANVIVLVIEVIYNLLTGVYKI